MIEPINNYTKNLKKQINKLDAQRFKILEDLKLLTDCTEELNIAKYYRYSNNLLNVTIELQAMQKHYKKVVEIKSQCEKESGIKSAMHYGLCIAKTEDEKIHAQKLMDNAMHRLEVLFFARVKNLTAKKYDVLTPI